jgi:predicted permease
VASLPGVRSAGLISELPLSGAYASGTTHVEASEVVPEDERAFEADRRRVSPGYFETMGVELLAGRLIRDSDGADAPLVAVVDERFARRFWPDESAVGKRVAVDRAEDDELRWREVVGVVGHSRHYSVDRIGREQIYLPLRQRPTTSMFLSLRTGLDPVSLAPAVRSEVWEVEATQPVADVQSMAARVDAAVSQRRFNLVLFAGFAALAAILAAVGLYGVLSYSAAQRRQEIGIRMALGAARADVVGLILRRGLGLLGLGLASGAGLALVFDRLMRSMLYEVEPGDPSIYLAVALLLGTVGYIACLLPAWRAGGLHPARVLHEE